MNHDTIKELIEEMLNKLTVEFEHVEVIVDEVHPIFAIKTNDSGVLIGNNGENLRALNHIVRKTASFRSEYTQENEENRDQFLVDVNNYHRKKIQDIKSQAQILAERAKMFKSNVEMNPMNAYERMIVHSIFSGDTEIKTESEGEGKFRRVILKYVVSESSIVKDNELKV